VSVRLFGVPKSSATLAAVLDKATFGGVLVSDDAAVYQNFSKAQKGWAHLLRKAMKLTLQAAENEIYRAFANALLTLWQGLPDSRGQALHGGHATAESRRTERRIARLVCGALVGRDADSGRGEK
jgi:hypothetical protein